MHTNIWDVSINQLVDDICYCENVAKVLNNSKMEVISDDVEAEEEDDDEGDNKADRKNMTGEDEGDKDSMDMVNSLDGYEDNEA